MMQKCNRNILMLVFVMLFEFVSKKERVNEQIMQIYNDDSFNGSVCHFVALMINNFLALLALVIFYGY